MGEFNSDHYYIYYCGQKSLRRNGVALTISRRIWNAVLGCNLKNDRLISVHFQGKPFNITAIQVCTPTTDAEEAEVNQLWSPTTPSRTNNKIHHFHHRELECKSRKSRDTCINRQACPWSTNWSISKTNWVLSREHTGHSKHPFPTTQEMTLYMDITRWSILKSNWLYSLQPNVEKLYAESRKKTWSWV